MALPLSNRSPMDIARPFIRLPFAFDADRLAQEVNELPDSAWMEHPNRMQGNSALALVSRRGEDNDEFAGAMSETPHLKSCPNLRQTLASFDEVIGRSRLMKLASGSEVSMHVDFNYHWYSKVRIHIPLITNPKVVFFCGGQQVHMKAGEAWIFNAWRRHKVTNSSDHDRIHLVIDLAGSSRFWNIVEDAIRFPVGSESPEFDAAIKVLKYDATKNADIRVEKFNIAPVMAPGEIDALIADLVRDFEANPENNEQLVQVYKKLLFNFSKDWREIWHQHGYDEDGLPHYRQLIERTFKSLEADHRALVTQSNRIGVNPIIVQRILRAALAPEVREQFAKPDS